MGELIPKALITSARPEYWIPFLTTHAAYCKRNGLSLDERVARADRDGWYRTLQRIVRGDDPARPERLRAAARRVAHLADEGGRDRLAATLRRHDLGGELTSDRRSDLELALAVYERHPTLFEEAARFKQAAAKDNFWEYLPRRASRGGSPPSPTATEALRAAMSEYHFGYGHSAYCQLDVEDDERELRFMFSRGNAHRSHGIINREEEREQSDYTPEACDLAVLDRVTGRLSLSIGKLPHVEFTRRLFGRVLYGDESYFSVSAIYTGAPLVERGAAALSPRGIPGLREVILRKLTLRHEDGGHCMLGHDESSVFPCYQRAFEMLTQEGHVVTHMKFDLRYADSSRFRPLEIHTPNHIIFDRHNADAIVREYLVARGFASFGPDHLDLAA